MSKELKPCPLCGHKASDETGMYGAVCLNKACPMSNLYADTKYWNYRPIEDALRDEITKAKEAIEPIDSSRERLCRNQLVELFNNDAELARKDTEIAALDGLIKALEELIDSGYYEITGDYPPTADEKKCFDRIICYERQLAEIRKKK